MLFNLLTNNLCLLCVVPEDPDAEIDEDTQSLLTSDFEIGHYIRERIVPRAVLYFTGKCRRNTITWKVMPCNHNYSYYFYQILPKTFCLYTFWNFTTGFVKVQKKFIRLLSSFKETSTFYKQCLLIWNLCTFISQNTRFIELYNISLRLELETLWTGLSGPPTHCHSTIHPGYGHN